MKKKALFHPQSHLFRFGSRILLQQPSMMCKVSLLKNQRKINGSLGLYTYQTFCQINPECKSCFLPNIKGLTPFLVRFSNKYALPFLVNFNLISEISL